MKMCDASYNVAAHAMDTEISFDVLLVSIADSSGSWYDSVIFKSKCYVWPVIIL